MVTLGRGAGPARRASRSCPAGPLPPASMIPPGTATAARSERGSARLPAGAQAAARGVDCGDASDGRADRRAAAADHVGDPVERRGGGMCHRRRQLGDRLQRSVRRVEVEHDPACGSVGRRPAGDHELAVGRGHRRVAQRHGQPGRHARGRAGRPGEDRVQPARARVAADDVGLPRDHRRRDVRRRLRQVADDARAAARVDLDDLVELARPVAAAEDVGRPAEADGRGVVAHARQRSAHRVAMTRDEADVRHRGVGRVQAAEQERARTARRGGGVLQRRGQGAHRSLDHRDRARLGRSLVPDGRSRRRPRARMLRRGAGGSGGES